MRQLKEAQYAEAMSNSMHRDSVVTYRFVPLIIESFGLIDSIGSRWLRNMFRNDPGRPDRILTELSLTIWRSNADLLAEARAISLLFLASQGS